jgi:3-mercaptopyruvate sulfurtransferase SseA
MGFKDVSVMTDGIKGWKAKGKPTVAPSQAVKPPADISSPASPQKKS